MRLGDLDILRAEIEKMTPWLVKIHVLEVIDRTPTVMKESCKNCIHFMQYRKDYESEVEGADGDCYLRLVYSNDKQFSARTVDDFCSDWR